MTVVHLWCWSVECSDELDWSVLDNAEQARALRFTQERHRVAFRRAHAGLRAILGRWLGAAPASLAFETGPHGKPRLANQGAPYFSFSHSGTIASVAVSANFEIGLDIERCRHINAFEFASHYFSLAEQTALARLPAALQHKAFFEAWTRKEAFVKALGLGLSMPLDSFTVSLGPGNLPALVALDNAPAEPASWQFTSFCPASGFLGAIAARAVGWTVKIEDARDADLPSPY